ncbi:MAG: 50S ribosome-binding GTPase [Deltaproteobacteria bacterium]|nr:50S ribosome-binding GTPase [Deltaproteobacteria bacterium]
MVYLDSAVDSLYFHPVDNPMEAGRRTMKQIILGTAGHIDHGKTTLIKALTGIDTDRLKEEKERGITIELGFAHMVLPGGQHLGIVDVPGHEKFVKNMVAGAHGNLSIVENSIRTGRSDKSRYGGIGLARTG